MPPKKETEAQRAVRLQRHALEASSKADLAAVQGLLKTKPVVLQKVKRFLVQSGDLQDTIATAMTAAATDLDKSKESATVEEPGDSSSSILPSVEDDKVGKLPIHGSHHVLADLSPAVLSFFLRVLELAVFSKANMKPYVRKGCKEPPKDVLLQLIEYATNLPSVTPVKAKVVGDVAEMLMNKNIVLGWRCAGMFPPD